LQGHVLLESEPPEPFEGLQVEALANARGHSVPITRSQPVLGIDHPQEALGGSLRENGHELCDPCAAVAVFGTCAARLNNRNADPEGCNFLRRIRLALSCPAKCREDNRLFGDSSAIRQKLRPT
jgi:hypothetical protein